MVTAQRVSVLSEDIFELETKPATVTLEKAPTEDEKGITRFTAEFDNEAFGSVSTTMTDIPSLGEMDKLIVPDNVAIIENEAFKGINVQAVIIPDTCESIGAGAFSNCDRLIYVKLPTGIQISDTAFTDSALVRFDYVN